MLRYLLEVALDDDRLTERERRVIVNRALKRIPRRWKYAWSARCLVPLLCVFAFSHYFFFPVVASRWPLGQYLSYGGASVVAALWVLLQSRKAARYYRTFLCTELRDSGIDLCEQCGAVLPECSVESGRVCSRCAAKATCMPPWERKRP